MKESPSQQDTGDGVHVVCEVFEKLLQAGRQPRIEDYLATVSPDDHNSVFRDLLKTEVQYRLSKGQQPTAAEYAERFQPEKELVSEVLRLVENGRTANEQILDETIVQTVTDTTKIHDTAIDKISSLGRYETRELLGEGGFGKVYRAWDRELERDVAIKVLHGAGTQDARRFVQEAQTAAVLNHPNICPVYDMGQSDGAQYIVMGFVKGKSLQEFIESGKSISPRQAVHTVYKLTSALTEAHRQGIVHRDLKPANIMISAKRNQLVILDFGLARQLNSKEARLTLSGQLLGTPLYMAPEQVRADIDRVGPSSDIYSLGVILYRMLADRGPFTGSVAEVFAQILYEEPEPPSAFRPGLSPELDAICLKAIAKDPARRYQSMAELGRALADFLKGKTKSPAPSQEKQDGGLDLDWLSVPEMEVARPATPSPSIPPANRPVPSATSPASSPAKKRPAPSPAAHSDTSPCPKCDAPRPAGAKLCEACGFHQGLNQQFDAIAKQGDASEPEKQSWLAEQLCETETPEGLALAVACIVPIVALIFVALLYSLFGAWAFLGVGVLFLAVIPVLAKIVGWRLGPASLSLYYCRMRGWRTIWRPSHGPNVLDLRYSMTADADLESMKEKWNIEVLDLESTQVTDAAIEPLARLESVKSLVLRRTKISAQGVARLRQLLPKTRIWY